jgi:hypothetical protein
MSAKISKTRREAFLRAVRETGNQTLAAERAKVSRSWVQLHRSGDPAFDADVRAALKASFDKLRMSGERKPPSGWGHLDGEELVVKGTGGSALRDAAGAAPQDERKKGKRIQIARARLKQWTPRVEDRFLATLAATCNVKAACAEVGLTAASAYAHRKRWPAFAERWDAAILAGYERLDAGLIAGAIALLDPELPELYGPPIEAVVAPVSVDDAIRLVRLHERRAREAAWRRLGRARGCGPRWPGVAARRTETDGA